MNESDHIRGRLELKDEELLDLKKMLKVKHDEWSELNIRLSLNEKKIDSLQKELDEKANKHKQALEEAKVDGQKKIKSVFEQQISMMFLFFSSRQCEEAMAVLQNDNEQLEQEKTALKERLKQLTKDTLFNDIMKKKTAGLQRTSGSLSSYRVIAYSSSTSNSTLGPVVDGSVSPQRPLASASGAENNVVSTASEHEVRRWISIVSFINEALFLLGVCASQHCSSSERRTLAFEDDSIIC